MGWNAPSSLVPIVVTKQYERSWDMVLFVLRELILQTCMSSHPVGRDVWFLVQSFVYFHTSCVRTAKALARLYKCASSPEHSLVRAYVISTIISKAGSNAIIWAASSEFGTYRLCEQRRFRRASASAQSRQNLHCSLIQAVSQEEPSDRKPDPWPLSMAGHARLKFVTTECSKTHIRLTGLILEFEQCRITIP